MSRLDRFVERLTCIPAPLSAARRAAMLPPVEVSGSSDFVGAVVEEAVGAGLSGTELIPPPLSTSRPFNTPSNSFALVKYSPRLPINSTYIPHPSYFSPKLFTLAYSLCSKNAWKNCSAFKYPTNARSLSPAVSSVCAWAAVRCLFAELGEGEVCVLAHDGGWWWQQGEGREGGGIGKSDVV
jgi:hypothetical protein